MESTRRILNVVSLAVAFLAITSEAGAQGAPPLYTGSSAQVLDWSNRPASTPRRIAIVGDVDRPGVYETLRPRLVASDIMQVAGSRAVAGDWFKRYHAGLTAVDEPTFSADRSLVSHGDVLVVRRSGDRPRSSEKPATDDIHVAMIGLQPFPVVLKVGAGERSLAGLFSRLKQSSEAAAAATISGSGARERLENGDVIVIESRWIDRSLLAGCELILPTRPLEAPANAAPSPAVTAAPESPPQEAFAALLDAPTPPRLTAEEPAPILTPPTIPTVPEIAPSEPRPETPRVVAEAVPEPMSEPALQAAAGPAPFRRDGIRNADFELKSADAAAGSNLRSLLVLAALGILGLGVALLWLSSEGRLRAARRLQPVPMEPSTAPSAEAPSPIDPLQAIVRGELGIEEEPVVIPAQISLHGEATGQKRLIIHPPQPLAGPHFAAAPSAVTASARTQAMPQPRKAAAAPRGPVRSQKDTEGLLDRVLLAMQREGRQ